MTISAAAGGRTSSPSREPRRKDLITLSGCAFDPLLTGSQEERQAPRQQEPEKRAREENLESKEMGGRKSSEGRTEEEEEGKSGRKRSRQ